MTWPTQCRRRHSRLPVEGEKGTIEFEFPEPGCGWCRMPLRDLSAAGLSFVLSHELPGLTVGDRIEHAKLRIEGQVIEVEMLVMRLKPDAVEGAVCGALLYPVEDRDVLLLREVIRALQHYSAAPVTP